MEQKYIEGTNQQYSICDDGTVISHWRIRYTKGKYVIINKAVTIKPILTGSRVKLRIKINGKFRTFNVNKLVYDAFGDGKETNMSQIIKHVDNDPFNCHINNLIVEFKWKEQTGKDEPLTGVENVMRYRTSKKGKEFISNYKRPITDNFIRAKRKAQIKRIAEIKRSYVASQLRISTEDLTDELYQFYKATLKLKRLIKTKRNGKDQKLSAVDNNSM